MGMEIREMIRSLELLKNEIEWDYPLEYQILLDGVISILMEIEHDRQSKAMDGQATTGDGATS